MLKKAFTVLALAAAMTSAHSGPILINEGFDNVSSLTGAGWIMTNASTPVGTTSWFQGNESVFASKSGAPESYIAANFNNALPGGSLANWLLTPAFSTATNLAISFWARADIFDPYFDQLAFGLVDGSGNLNSFVQNSLVTVLGDWTQYTLYVNGQGAGSTARFAIEYVGNIDDANYVGVDDLTVSVDVPEPSSWALVGISLLGLSAVRRRRSQR